MMVLMGSPCARLFISILSALHAGTQQRWNEPSLVLSHVQARNSVVPVAHGPTLHVPPLFWQSALSLANMPVLPKNMTDSTTRTRSPMAAIMIVLIEMPWPCFIWMPPSLGESA